MNATYNGERHMMYVPRGGGQVEIHRYSQSDMVDCFSPWQLAELNHNGRVQSHDGAWIDMIWAALHYEKMADAAAAKQVAA